MAFAESSSFLHGKNVIAEAKCIETITKNVFRLSLQMLQNYLDRLHNNFSNTFQMCHITEHLVLHSRKTCLKPELAFIFLDFSQQFPRKTLASNTGWGHPTEVLRKKIKIERLAFFFLDFSEQLPWKLSPHIVEWVHPTEV